MRPLNCAGKIIIINHLFMHTYLIMPLSGWQCNVLVEANKLDGTGCNFWFSESNLLPYWNKCTHLARFYTFSDCFGELIEMCMTLGEVSRRSLYIMLKKPSFYLLRKSRWLMAKG